MSRERRMNLFRQMAFGSCSCNTLLGRTDLIAMFSVSLAAISSKQATTTQQTRKEKLTLD
jgi:hypothetical protein